MKTRGFKPANVQGLCSGALRTHPQKERLSSAELDPHLPEAVWSRDPQEGLDAHRTLAAGWHRG